MKKRFLSLLIASALIMSTTVTVFAGNTELQDYYLSAKDTGFSYEHSPLDNPGISKDIIADPDAVYGYSPAPSSERFAAYSGIDWSDAAQVNIAKSERMAAYKAGSVDIDPAVDACLGLYDHYFTAYVITGNADAYSKEDEAFVSLIGHPYPDYSLAPGSKYKNYSVFIVRKTIKGKAGAVYPWFDEPGMATQVVLPAPVKDLLADGSLERIEYR